MQEKSKISINLSSKKKFSVGSVFYKWAFEAGRAIIILIELVALGALGYRFMIDGQVVDLHDEIKKQLSLVQFQSEDEKNYRGIQDRLTNIKLISEETEGKIQVMNDIIASINKGEFTETDLAVNQNSISLSANTISVFVVENLVNRLQEYPQVTSIVIDEINTSSSGIKFRLRITLVKSQLSA